MKKILTYRKCLPSARMLRDAIQRETGDKYLIVTDPGKVGRDGVLVRFGSSSPLPVGIPDTKFNPAKFCEMSVHKGIFSRRMLEQGFAVPEFHNTGEPIEYPVLVRTTLTGFKGKGIILCRNRDEFYRAFVGNVWWTPYVNVDYEVRAICTGGELTKVYYKVPFQGQEVTDPPIRVGWHFKKVDHDGKFGKLAEIARAIHDIFGGKFFALDAGWDTNRKEYFVFEMNSAFGMNQFTSEMVANYLTKELFPA